ncbi:MAG: Xylan alpha-(1-_2)-glucuronosidase [Firmicutes bacterium]|nr:Xylan alpha-(1->2)-glucuronosidase [Bacillota bacterium]
MKLRLLCASSPFFRHDQIPKNWWGARYWLEQIDTDAYPYVDENHLQDAGERFKEFIRFTLKTGYNGIIMHELLHYINFDLVGDGYEIYPENCKFRIRHDKYHDYFFDFFMYAEELNKDIYVLFDAPTLTPPLKEYVGEISAENPRIIDTLAKGVEELFQKYPMVDGVMIRIGEGGGTHDIQDYYSMIIFDTIASTQSLLDALIEVAERYDKKVIFRTWSMGMSLGELGDLHTNPETYKALLSKYDEEDPLIASMKFVRGDFTQYLEFNPTIGIGNIPQIIEIQAVCEYEGFSMYPNYLGELAQESFQHAINRNVIGMWNWAQWGNPLGAGTFSLFRFHGFWSNTDANTYAYSRLAWNPYLDVNDITATWVMKNFGDNLTTIENFTKMLLISDDANRKALYISDYSDQMTYLGDTTWLPHQLWIMWDVPTSGSGARIDLNKIVWYFNCRRNES